MSQENGVRIKIAGASLATLILVAGVSWYVFSTNSRIENLQSRQTQLRGELTDTQTELAATSDELSSTKIDLSSTKQELASTQTDLASTKKNLTSTRESLAATQGDLLSTQVDLTTTKTNLASTQTELSTTKEELTTTATSLSETQRDLTFTQQNLAATRSSLEATQGDLSSTKEDLASTKGDLATTRRNLTSTQGDLASTSTALSDTQEELNSTKASLESTRTLLSSTSRGLSSLRTDLSQTDSRLTTVRSDLDEIMDTYGNIDTLNEEVASLETEIAKLEAEREPLILESSRSWFRCSGSMEPKLTCLDEATYLNNFHAEDIVVGATISFSATEECGLSGERISHRVMKIMEIDGVLHFWPRGDNNRRADGCWIPEGNVNGYMIEIHKDVFADTANADLREAFNGVKGEYDKAIDVYRNYCRRHTVSSGQCVLAEPHYSRAGVLQREAGDLWERLECWRGIMDEWSYPDELGNMLNEGLLLRGKSDCDGVGA